MRALSAALAIQEGLKPLAEDVRRQAHGVEFKMRMGINTGLVVVGAIGRDLRMDYTAVGDTTNLAARLLGLAKPGQIVVEPAHPPPPGRVLRLRGPGRFPGQGQDRAGARLRGHGRAIRPHEARGLERAWAHPAGRARARARGCSNQPPGSRQARAPSCCSSGEPGVGKSRLLYEFLRQARRHRSPRAGDDVRVVRPHDGVPPDRGVAAALPRALSEGVDRRGGPASRRRPASAPRLSRARSRVHSARPLPRRVRAAGISQSPVRARSSRSGPSACFVTCCSARASRRRSSSSSKTCTGSTRPRRNSSRILAAGLPGHRILLVLTTRPGYAAPWLAPPLAETITVEGLGGGDVRGMVRTLLAAEEVSEQLFKMLAEKSEGNPLYVEEILRQLLETGGIVVESGEARLSRPDVTVPATIHDIIAARIDRLADTLKQTLQGAAVVGRRFGISLVSRILELASELRWPGTSGTLHALDFVFPSAQEPELMYSFKHALTQDVVYARRAGAPAANVPRGGRARSRRAVRRTDRRRRRADRVPLRARAVWDKATTYLEAGRGQGPAEVGAPGGTASFEEALEALRHLPETPETTGARDRCAPRAPGLALSPRRVREDADLPAGSRDHGRRDLGFAPARVGLHPHRRILPPDGPVRRGANARRASAEPWATSYRTSHSRATRASISG